MKEKNPKNILFLVRWYPNRYDPMLGLFVQRHAEAAALFNNISIVYAEALKSTTERSEAHVSDENNVFTVRMYYRAWPQQNILTPLINNILYFLAIIKGMRIVFRRNGRPALIHVHILSRLALPAMWCNFFCGIPYMITEHWSRYLPLRNEFNGKLRKWFTKFAVKQAAMLTTVTENLREAMLSHGLYNRNTVVLPNVVDMERFKINPHKSHSKIRMVHVSCFEDRSKNITGIINVVAKMKLITADFECVMIGDGMDFSYAVTYAREQGIHSDMLRFTGLLEGDALAKELADADFFVLFSHYENMPVVILEAFACGLPVIATKVGGIPEMVNESNGMLVSPANEDELLQAILKMMNVYDQYNPEKIRDSVALVYGNQAVGKKLSEWYQQVISQ